jgi:hypothetical protein
VADSDLRTSAAGRKVPIRAGIALKEASTNSVANTAASTDHADGMVSMPPRLALGAYDGQRIGKP